MKTNKAVPDFYLTYNQAYCIENYIHLVAKTICYEKTGIVYRDIRHALVFFCERWYLKKEKKSAAKFLKETRKDVEDAVKGLTEAQLTFKPARMYEREECLKHIAVTEQALWGMMDANLKQPATPEKRTDVKWADEDVIKKIEDRSTKSKQWTR
ncbi:MAG: hypothetical protein WDO16_13875 [Bacteroidota bacterium]